MCLLFFFLGTSDPYVKFKIAGKEVFRSKTIHKNLNPVWDERVSLLVETLRDPLYVKVQKISAEAKMSPSSKMSFFKLMLNLSVEVIKGKRSSFVPSLYLK